MNLNIQRALARFSVHGRRRNGAEKSAVTGSIYYHFATAFGKKCPIKSQVFGLKRAVVGLFRHASEWLSLASK